MKVLSLFDGMACGMLAMQKAGIQVERYVAFEYDETTANAQKGRPYGFAALTSAHNFPMIEHRGDVFQADFTEFKGFDFLIGGSPCTYWSIAQTKNRETVASGMGWELFSQYVRALHEAKPMYFVYENNKSMSKAIRASIDEAFGFEAICINSALVSAQNRQRLYWVGKRNLDGTYSKVHMDQPEDRGILLKDILESTTRIPEYGSNDKSRPVTWSYAKQGPGQIEKNCFPENPNKQLYDYVAQPVLAEAACMRYERSVEAKAVRKQYEAGEIHHGYHELSELHPRPDGKTNTLSTVLKDNPVLEPVHVAENAVTYAIPIEFEGYRPVKAVSCADGKEYPVYEVKDGFITINAKRYAIKLQDGFYIIRKLTVTECKRLQTVPEWYEFPVSDTQAYKMLGNGWTVEVIAHLISATQTAI